MNTTDRKRRAQHLHDVAAAGGAVCRDSRTSGSPDEFSRAMQTVHDVALGSGADCALWRPGSQDPLATWEPGQHYATSGGMRPAYREFQPGNYAALSADAAFADDSELSPELCEARERALEYAAKRNREQGNQSAGFCPDFSV